LDRIRLFVASCIALVTTAMVFSPHRDVLHAVAADSRIAEQQIGVVLSPAFSGFTASVVLTLVFGSLLVYYRSRGGYRAVHLNIEAREAEIPERVETPAVRARQAAS
jgi:hypothetical protein